jgi:hypothetical protein
MTKGSADDKVEEVSMTTCVLPFRTRKRKADFGESNRLLLRYTAVHRTKVLTQL